MKTLRRAPVAALPGHRLFRGAWKAMPLLGEEESECIRIAADDVLPLTRRSVEEIAVQVIHLVYHLLVDPLLHQVILLLIREFENLIGGFHAADHFLFREARVAHGHNFIEGDEAVVIDVGCRGGHGLFGGGRILLGASRGLNGGLAVFRFHRAGVRGDHVAAPRAKRAADERSEDPVL
jgi:hypothetical protein